MENGSFQKLTLNSLDRPSIEENIEETLMAHKSALQKKQASQFEVMNFKTIPADIRKTSTVDALISQNEDLMARLKVTLLRLSAIEDENSALNSEISELKKSFSTQSDLMMIWKEKEKNWKEKNNQLEKEIKVFHERFPDFQKMESQIERYKKYQDRVKSTIKPYLQQLKDYAHSLHLQIQSLNQDLDQKDSEISKLKLQIETLKDESSHREQFYTMTQNELVSSFEKDRDQLQHEIKNLQEISNVLELKAQKLDRAIERQDELENLVISLRRSKEESIASNQNELENLRESQRELKSENNELRMLSQDLRQQLSNLQQESHEINNRRDALDEQVTNLRYMWGQKCEENEKLKISLSSLEKLNAELSTQLNQIRQQNKSVTGGI
jgi:chromosome segregation ATPase